MLERKFEPYVHAYRLHAPVMVVLVHMHHFFLLGVVNKLHIHTSGLRLVCIFGCNKYKNTHVV